MLKYGLSKNALEENPLYHPEECNGYSGVSLHPPSVRGFLLMGYGALCNKAFLEGHFFYSATCFFRIINQR